MEECRQRNWDESGSAEGLSAVVSGSLLSAAARSLPTQAATARKPWISDKTLEHIASRNLARATGNHCLEASLNKLIKQSAKHDRNKWLEEQLESGDWTPVKQYRKGVRHPPGRLQDLDGKLVNSDARADTLASYYEQIQWGAGWETLDTRLPYPHTLWDHH